VINMNWMRSHIPDIHRRIEARYVRRMLFIICTLAIMGLPPAAFPSPQALAQSTKTKAKTGVEKTNASKESASNYAEASFKPSNFRDPFLNPLLKKEESNKDQEVDRGLPPPGIAGTFIAEAVLKGISIKGDERLAIVKGNGNRAYFLRQGDKLFDGYLKTIHRDSITLVRITKMRSGKVITQEVTKKLRTP
jgi:hypothetical protein